MIPYILSFLGGYLIGSIPTGYLVVKFGSKIDITKAGSGNVGALNAGVVTGSKFTGILVGVIDALKGVAVVVVLKGTTEGFLPNGLGLIGAVVGHNYPVWLRFKGGRGLATACGGLFAIGLAYTIVWCATWLALKLAHRTVLAANVVSTITAPLVLFLIPETSIAMVMTSPTDPQSFRLFTVALSILLLVSHSDGLSEIARRKPKNNT